MIKQIQFRGISRTPSDRMVSDGGCSESLNVQMDNTEVAPACMPEDVTAARVGQAAVTGTDDYIYIHKGSTYTNYITLGARTVKAYIGGTQSATIVTFAQDETYRSASAIGNTLLLVTDRHIHYALFKDGAYIYLGTRIPEPQVNFVATPATEEDIWGYNPDGPVHAIDDSEITSNETKYYEIWSEITNMSAEQQIETWNKLGKGYASLSSGSDDDAFLDDISEYCWLRYNALIKINRSEGWFCSPVFVRAAVRLYDGSYIYQTVPYLLHTGDNRFYEFRKLRSYGTLRNHYVRSILYSVFKAEAQVTWDIGDWDDIVTSIDFFISTDVCNPKVNSVIQGAEAVEGDEELYTFIFKDQSGLNNFNDIKDELLSKTLFYKVETKDATEIGEGITVELKPYSQDELVVKERLQDDELSFHETLAAGPVMQYNQRLVLSGTQTLLTTGYPFLQSVKWKDYRPGIFDDVVYRFVYRIRAKDGTSYSVIARNADGSDTFPVESRILDDDNTYYGVPCGWMYYPDPRCYRVDIYICDTGDAEAALYSVPMKEHPGLNGAYAMCSLAEPLTSLKDNPDTPDAPLPTPSDENRLMSSDRNVLSVSELSNPFILPASGKVTFDDEIISSATTTKALSSGQFGQFPLYVFTKGGIWAVELDNMGLPVSSKPLSRDVTNSADSVTPIDQAIVFATDKSVLLLEGSQITDIAPYMSGRQFADGIPDDVLTDIGTWSPLSGVLLDRTPFMQYMEDAHGLYDYTGRRLVFISRSMSSFQYVYKLDTQTWHKLAIGDVTLGTILNSYPEAFISAVDGETGHRRILDFSTNLKTSTTALRGAIITRPLALDATDVRKAVTALRFRGLFHKGHVKYKILGSMDGLTWGELHSLRGGSYMYFRLVILTEMLPAERLSYVDIDFETRLTNKIR